MSRFDTEGGSGVGVPVPTVLVVDDEPELVAMYAEWLADAFAIRTATSGHQALDRVDESVDVVLLDRRMPGLDGDAVLSEIRRLGLGCRVALVTGIEPTVDILDLGFDDYVLKPVSRADLFRVVEALLARSAYDEGLREYFASVSKYAVLETHGGPETHDHPACQELRAQIDALRRELREQLARFDDRDLKAVFRAIESDSSNGSNQLAW